MFEVGNKIEVLDTCSDTDLMEWIEENARGVDEVVEVNEEARLLWCKNLPGAISFDDVVLYDDDLYEYWGYDQ